MAFHKEQSNKPFRSEVLGLSVDICNDIVQSAAELHARGGGQIITLNVEMIMGAIKDSEINYVIRNADLVIPDSYGVRWALQLQGVFISPNPGIEIARKLLSYAESNSWKVVLIGGSQKVIQQLQKNLIRELPNLKISMAMHGYQTKSEWAVIEKEIRIIKPDLVLVALGFPLQEIWAMKNKQNCSGLWIGVGGSFDIWSGLKKRAPRLIRRLNLEWLYRLTKEPSRCKRAKSLPAFIWAVVKSQKKL